MTVTAPSNTTVAAAGKVAAYSELIALSICLPACSMTSAPFALWHTGGKTVTKLVTPDEKQSQLFKLVSLITGWKNSLKGGCCLQLLWLPDKGQLQLKQLSPDCSGWEVGLGGGIERTSFPSHHCLAWSLLKALCQSHGCRFCQEGSEAAETLWGCACMHLHGTEQPPPPHA